MNGWFMVFNWQFFQYLMLRNCLRVTGMHLIRVLNSFKDRREYFIRRQLFATIFLGSFSWQMVFSQGLAPNQALLMQGLAASGGGVNPTSVNSQSLNN